MQNKIVVSAIVLIAVFLAGFIPEYIKANRLDAELRQVQRENVATELRELVGLAYVQANQKNYGLAGETSSRFFSQARSAADQETDTGRRKGLEDLLTMRDKVVGAAAKGDAAVLGDLQELFFKTRQATQRPSKP